MKVGQAVNLLGYRVIAKNAESVFRALTLNLKRCTLTLKRCTLTL